MKEIPKRPGWFLLLKIAALQTLTNYTIKLGPQGYEKELLGVTLLVMLVNFFLLRHIIRFFSYVMIVVIFYASGVIVDKTLIAQEVIQMGSLNSDIWLPTLWVIFLGYYGDVFRLMLKFPIWAMAALGALGGSLACYRIYSSHPEILLSENFYPIVAILWAVFMPFSLIIFRKSVEKKLGIQS